MGFEDGKAKLSVNSSFMQDVVSKKYTDVLTRGFSEVMGFPAEVEILCVEKPTEVNPILAAEEQSAAFNRYSPEEIEKSSQGGDYEYTFATFIVGNSNKVLPMRQPRPWQPIRPRPTTRCSSTAVRGWAKPT